MKDKEVLQKAIDIALEKGMSHTVVDEGTFYQTYARIKLRTGETYHPTGFSPKDCCGLIFNHEFAKAFWGGIKKDADIYLKWERQNCPNKDLIMAEGWIFDYQYHLQEMVLEENPIDYLRKFI